MRALLLFLSLEIKDMTSDVFFYLQSLETEVQNINIHPKSMEGVICVFKNVQFFSTENKRNKQNVDR